MKITTTTTTITATKSVTIPVFLKIAVYKAHSIHYII